MFLDGVIANLMEPADTGRIVRVVEIGRDAEAPSEPAPIGCRVKDMSGGQRVDAGMADPRDVVAAVHAAGQGPPQPARPDIFDESLALDAKLAAFDRERSERSLNVYEYGARMAAAELRQRHRTAIVDEDYFGRES